MALSDEEYKNGRLLEEAVLSGDLERVKFLIEDKQVNVNFHDDGAKLALHEAAMRGHLSIVEYLVSKGANINGVEHLEQPYTPLMYAVNRGHVEIAKYLVQQGASTNSTSIKGHDLFDDAILSEKPEQMIDFVLDETKHTIDEYNSKGLTPLIRAVSYGRVEAVLHLLNKGANLEKFSLTNNQSALHYAIFNKNDATLVELLLNHLKKVDESKLVSFVNHADSRGRTAFHEACREFKRESFKLLDNHNADRKLRDADGLTAGDLIDVRVKNYE